MRSVLISALIAGFLIRGVSAKKGMDPSDQVQRLVDHAWASLPHQDAKRKLSWTLALAPPIPQKWPTDGTVVYYAYGTAFDPSLRDGERIAAPWANVLECLSCKPQVRLVLLEKELHEIGTQGVHPVAAADVPTGAERADAAKQLRVQSAPSSPTSLRRVYCFCPKTNGLISAAILANHAAFGDWLSCE